MTVLMIAEHDNSELSEQTAKALSAALAIGDDVDILVAGRHVGPVAEAAAGLKGVRKVLVAEADHLEHQLAEAVAATIVLSSSGYDTLIAPATTTGKNVMPRVAALLDVMQISEVMEIVSGDTFRRPIYAGNAIQTVRSSDKIKVLTIRTSAFRAAESGGSAVIEPVNAGADPNLSEFIEATTPDTDRPQLTGAKIVVAGGRALGSKAKFDDLILPLADTLKAAVGASRAAVDAGYAPNDWQVGQTGKIVAPGLYIAIGISGAIQHVAGMSESAVIVAINKDAEAPIFSIADYGLVGDLFDIVPELQRSLQG